MDHGKKMKKEFDTSMFKKKAKASKKRDIREMGAKAMHRYKKKSKKKMYKPMMK